MQGKEETEGVSGDKAGARSLRSSALRFWGTVLERFPDSLDFNCFWGAFLQAVEPQMPRMATEVSSLLLWILLCTSYILLLRNATPKATILGCSQGQRLLL